MITLKSCPNCNSQNIKQYRRVIQTPMVAYKIMPKINVDAFITSNYLICENCRLIFQSPRMTDSGIEKFYNQGYYRCTLDETDEQSDITEKSRAIVDSEIIKNQVGKITSHLDIGGSRGYLLDGIGASTKIMVEPNAKDLKIRGIKVYSNIIKVKPKLFDLITIIHTLEHLIDPVGCLKSLTKYLNKTGYLVIEVPTWKSPGGPLRLAHLYHFEPDVLRLMCMKVELEIVHTEFTPHLMLICQKA